MLEPLLIGGQGKELPVGRPADADQGARQEPLSVVEQHSVVAVDVPGRVRAQADDDAPAVLQVGFEADRLVPADGRQVGQEHDLDRGVRAEQIPKARVLELPRGQHADAGRALRRPLAVGKRVEGPRQETAGAIERVGGRLAINHHDRDGVADGDRQRPGVVQPQGVLPGPDLEDVLTRLAESVLLFQRERDRHRGVRLEIDELLPQLGRGGPVGRPVQEQADRHLGPDGPAVIVQGGGHGKVRVDERERVAERHGRDGHVVGVLPGDVHRHHAGPVQDAGPRLGRPGRGRPGRRPASRPPPAAASRSAAGR